MNLIVQFQELIFHPFLNLLHKNITITTLYRLHFLLIIQRATMLNLQDSCTGQINSFLRHKVRAVWFRSVAKGAKMDCVHTLYRTVTAKCTHKTREASLSSPYYYILHYYNARRDRLRITFAGFLLFSVMPWLRRGNWNWRRLWTHRTYWNAHRMRKKIIDRKNNRSRFENESS